MIATPASQLPQKPLALLSVTDKTGLVAFARGLHELGFELLSTGGTAKLLREQQVPVTDVASYTGSPEIFDGRVKTLHPKVHGGILYDRDNAAHAAAARDHGIRQIALVVVNLYQFREEAVAKGLSREDAIEHIDIGGPTMLRAAAKNWLHVCPVVDPADYEPVLQALRRGELDRQHRQRLAAKTFAATSAYDAAIAAFYGSGDVAGDWPSSAANLSLQLVQPLRYGENPHQKAALYTDATSTPRGFAKLQLLSGKELSYNNILDLDAATALAAEFSEPCVVIVKHTNPCGVASGSQLSLAELYRRARACDPKSAFGGIIAVNQKVDVATAEAITSLFTECVAAPEFSDEALALLQTKPNLRVLKAPFAAPTSSTAAPSLQLRSVNGAVLIQEADGGSFATDAWRTVTKASPDAAALNDLRFAMIVAKHVKSNAIVFAKDGVTVAIGAGQMSRIDAANIAVAKAKEEQRSVSGSVMASDAFFPFRDTVDFAAEHGVRAIVQPGGSKRDQESIEAADARAIAMVFTGERHFRH